MPDNPRLLHPISQSGSRGPVGLHADLLEAGGRQKTARGPPGRVTVSGSLGGRAVPPTACPEQVRTAQEVWAGARVTPLPL